MTKMKIGATRLTVLMASCALIAATGCGAPNDLEQWEQPEEFDTLEQPITGGWTALSLVNGWQNFSGSAPTVAVGIVNGVVTFRGALNGSQATDDIAFYLPPAFWPYFEQNGEVTAGADYVRMRVAMAGSAQGTITYIPDVFGGAGTPHAMSIVADSSSGNPRSFVSLDGVTFDRTVDDSTPLEPDSFWAGVYPFRLQGPHALPDGMGAWIKNVGGFVRFQGFLQGSGEGLAGYLFTIPSQFRTNQTVTIPASPSTGWGQLTIYPTGEVFINGDLAAAKHSTSLEGSFYSRTLSGNQPLTLLNGWSAHSARAVRVGNYGDVVRFQGAVSGGTSGTIAVLPSNMRPPSAVTLQAAAYQGMPARLTVHPNGNVTVDTTHPPLWATSLFLSLDGVSFAL